MIFLFLFHMHLCFPVHVRVDLHVCFCVTTVEHCKYQEEKMNKSMLGSWKIAVPPEKGRRRSMLAFKVRSVHLHATAAQERGNSRERKADQYRAVSTQIYPPTHPTRFWDMCIIKTSPTSQKRVLKDFRWFIRHLSSVVKSAALKKPCYPQVPGSILAEITSTQIHMDLSK